MGMTKSTDLFARREEAVDKIRKKAGVSGAFEIDGKFDVPAIQGQFAEDPMSLGICVFPADRAKAVSLRIWHGRSINFYTSLSPDQIDELVRALIMAKVRVSDYQGSLSDPEI